jgi:hypothetical protein
LSFAIQDWKNSRGSSGGDGCGSPVPPSAFSIFEMFPIVSGVKFRK